MSDLQINLLDDKPVFSSGLSVRIPGNSGCKVEVLRGHVPSVRKTSLSSDYHQRLSRQREKQQECNPGIPGIVVPKVLAFDNRSFTMEYLQMLDAIEFLERANPVTIKKRLQVVFDFIQWEFESTEWQTVSNDFFEDKLINIRSHVPVSVWELYYASCVNTLRQKMSPALSLPLGPCHGDLTLSNIMFSLDDNQIGLIDFLDSFLDSPLIDLIKLRQDTRFDWTITRYPHRHDRGKIQIVNRWMNALVESTFNNWILSSAFTCLEIINYLRIAPYVTTTKEHIYLSKILEELTLQLEVSPCI